MSEYYTVLRDQQDVHTTSEQRHAESDKEATVVEYRGRQLRDTLQDTPENREKDGLPPFPEMPAYWGGEMLEFPPPHDPLDRLFIQETEAPDRKRLKSVEWLDSKGVARRKLRVPAAEWERHKESIGRHYIEQNLTLKEIRDLMRRSYGFEATINQYKYHLARWQMRKNLTNVPTPLAESTASSRIMTSMTSHDADSNPSDRKHNAHDNVPTVDGGAHDVFEDTNLPHTSQKTKESTPAHFGPLLVWHGQYGDHTHAVIHDDKDQFWPAETASSAERDSMHVAEALGTSKTRRTIGGEKRDVLESAFVTDMYPRKSELEALAERTNLSQKQVENWFRNKRQRALPEEMKTKIHPLMWWDSSSEDEHVPDLSDRLVAMASPHEAVSSSSRAITGGPKGSVSSASIASSTTRHSRKGRRKGYQKPIDGPPDGIYFCTFCNGQSFETKYSWKRHEELKHTMGSRWVCHAGRAQIEDGTCSFCAATSVDEAHFRTHRGSVCSQRPIEERTFYRKDGFVQHFQGFHRATVSIKDWQAKGLLTQEQALPDMSSLTCGFCGEVCISWDARCDHIAKHFKKGATMDSWQVPAGFLQDQPDIQGRNIEGPQSPTGVKPTTLRESDVDLVRNEDQPQLIVFGLTSFDGEGPAAATEGEGRSTQVLDPQLNDPTVLRSRTT